MDFTFDPADVRRLCQKYGLPSTQLENGKHEGVVNEIWFAGDVVIRILKNPDYESDVWTETVAVPALLAKGIRTPKLLVFDADLDIVPRLVTIYERVPGVSLSKVEHLPDPEEFFWNLGSVIRSFHDGISSVEDPEKRLDPAWFLDTEALAENLDKNFPKIDRTYDTTEPTVFCHQDLHADNIIVHEGKLAAVIDWGDAGWGNRSVDLRFVPARYLKNALDGYGPISDSTSQNILLHQLDQYDYATRNNRSYGPYGDSSREEVLSLFG